MKKNKIIIIAIIVAVLLLLFVGAKILFSKGGKTVNQNSKLKVYEIKGDIDFSVKVLEVEDNVELVEKGVFEDDTVHKCKRIKLSIKNNSKETLYPTFFLGFNLVDSKNNVVSKWISYGSYIPEDSLGEPIATDETVEKCIYFEETTDATKLEIKAPSAVDDSSITDYENYYIKLK